MIIETYTHASIHTSEISPIDEAVEDERFRELQEHFEQRGFKFLVLEVTGITRRELMLVIFHSEINHQQMLVQVRSKLEGRQAIKQIDGGTMRIIGSNWKIEWGADSITMDGGHEIPSAVHELPRMLGEVRFEDIVVSLETAQICRFFAALLEQMEVPSDDPREIIENLLDGYPNPARVKKELEDMLINYLLLWFDGFGLS